MKHYSNTNNPIDFPKSENRMNERIKELWDKAAESTAAYPTGQNNSWETQVNFMEKFAELIVQECVRYFNEDYQRDFDTVWREDLSKGIKEHFGVEA
jgi:hypothetical protein